MILSIVMVLLTIVPNRHDRLNRCSTKTVDYKAILDSAPEGGYVVYCPSLPGCYSQGNSVEEALSWESRAVSVSVETLLPG